MHEENITADLKGQKQTLREKIWQRLTEAGVARFPGAFGRIPNFVGAEQAAQLAGQLSVFKKARFIKANPDSPQFPLRVLALEAGKVIFMAVPKLREERPFIKLDPARLRVHPMRAATIKGAFRYGEPVSLEEMPPIDLVITGCVAVTREGHRLGKGGGYSELEYALLREYSLVSDQTPVITTVHPLQLVPEIPWEPHDLSVDLIVTPEEIITPKNPLPKPPGIFWDLLSEEKLHKIPVLQKLKESQN